MSAISALWSQGSNPPASSLQPAMLAAQAIYGPAASSFWGDGCVSLGCNLSLSLPEDRFDRQPLWSPDGAVCIVADIRLDNRGELATKLSLIHPEELSDSSFLMAAWLRWGSSCLDHIIGGFVFAVWTPGRQELFAARDHAGERPLFYHRGPNLFALASMPKGLLVLPGVARGFHEPRIAESLACIQPDRTSSFFEGILRLPPGHLLRFTPSSFETRQYWHPANAAPVRYKRDEEYAEALLEVFDRATQARLRSTTGVGSHLSAGLDSSSVTASAARLLAAQGRRLTAFTAVPRPDFSGESEPWLVADEGPAAAEVAALYPNIDHVLVDPRGYDLVSAMRTWTAAWDEPVINLVNLLWFSAVFDQARNRGIGVLLQGGRGNETISWESWLILARLFRRGRWIDLCKTTVSLRRHGEISFKAAGRSATQGLLPRWLNRRLIPRQDLNSLYASLASPEWIRRYKLDSRTLDYSYYRASDPVTERIMFFERFDAGAHHAAVQAVTGVELRDPAGDKRVFEFCFGIPVEQYVAEGHSRSLVRRAMRGRLPESTLLRYSRGHQGADWYLHMSEAMSGLRHELSLLQQSPTARQAIDLPALARLLDTWPASGYHTKQVSLPWHYSLSRAVCMGYFLRSRESSAGVAPPAERPSPAVSNPPVAAPFS